MDIIKLDNQQLMRIEGAFNRIAGELRLLNEKIEALVPVVEETNSEEKDGSS